LPLLGGCLLNVPLTIPQRDLVGDPEVKAPAWELGGLPRVRAGTQVVVEVTTTTALDLDASTITLGGLELACTPLSEGARTYRCEGTPDGSELEGRVRLNAEMVDATGLGSDASREILIFDFTPPTAGCVLTPVPATAVDTIVFSVATSEDLLEGAPLVEANDERLTVSPLPQVQGQDRFKVTGPVGTNISGYVLTVTGTDLAGNPQAGDSLCDLESRTGSFLGKGPELAGEPVLTAEPYVQPDEIPVVRDEAVVRVVFPTVDPIDQGRSVVALSGVELDPDFDTPGAFQITLKGDEGDGLKSLDARLFDAAGNSLRVIRPNLIRFDFTPPVASCFVSPNPANGSDRVQITFTADELLTGGPIVSSKEVTVGSMLREGPYRWVGAITPITLGQDAEYVLDVKATDLVGNQGTGDTICPAADRTVRINDVPPVLDSAVLTVTGDRVFRAEGAPPVAGTGARLQVDLVTGSTL
ncbi:MAG: hypothetical protein KC656_30970, partial [Myxococcales bacterium]|nr:hypothetical protein [Myxococcales bacterium]